MRLAEISGKWADRWAEGCVVLVALVLAVVAARPYAGSWNDGSRLATVETLVDQHTWRIDDSTFVKVPGADKVGTALPCDPRDPVLVAHGTYDKLFIAGHYYSDKSPVPALLMAAGYQLWQAATGCTARTHPDRFCWTMTLAFSGGAYILAVWCLYRLGRRMGLPLFWRVLLSASLALATVALPYTQHVNNHILLLAVASGIALGVADLREDRFSWMRFAGLGFLAGLGYTIDLGVGPVFLLCTAGLVLTCCWRAGGVSPLILVTPHRIRGLTPPARRGVIAFALAALPWLVLHHVLNYHIGGTFRPANANPEYFRWPGSPFTTGNLTGSWIHSDAGSFLLYAASMLFGKRGFLGHNLPLFLTLPAYVVLLRRHRDIRAEVLWALGCCGGTWLLYAATSNNSSGQCCSIRWFVPLLAPAYLVLARFVQRCPRYRLDLLILSAWGMLLVLLMREGPWSGRMVPGFWLIQVAALGTWFLAHHLRRPPLEDPTQHPYTNGLGQSSPSGAAAFLLWITKRLSSGARANTTSATSTSTCPATSSSSSPA